jgi:hypothetical protein
LLRYFITILFLSNFIIVGAQQKKTVLKPNNIGIYYGLGNEDNFIFDDPDYLYKTTYIKASFSYLLNNSSFQWSLAVQPQVHFLKHQLLNEFFIQSSEENFEANRIRFTQLKSMRLYALTFEISVRRKILNKTEVFAFFAVGPGTIDTQTERLAKGFTFIENLGIGIRHEFLKNVFLEAKPTINHVSNAGLQLPNSGYNVLNFEIGLSWNL